MKIYKRTKSWHKKYGIKSFSKLKTSYVKVLNSYSKWNRTKFLDKAKMKDHKFRFSNPGDLNYRVFKCLYLQDKNVTPELQIKFKKLFTNGAAISGKYAHLNAKTIYKKLSLQMKKNMIP